MKALVVKWSKRVLLFGVLPLCVLFIAATFCISHFYQDEVKSYALAQINTHLTTAVAAENIELSIWQSFPNASLVFENVKIEETFEAKDTLLSAEKLYLKFNLWDFLDGDYTVQEVEVADATMHMKRDRKGSTNYHFWKTVADTTADQSFGFDLAEVVLKNVDYTYKDEQTDFELSLRANSTKLTGNFAEKVFSLSAKSDIDMHLLRTGKKIQVAEQHIGTNLAMEIDATTNKYTIAQSDFTFAGLPLRIAGLLDNSQPDFALDLSVSGDKIDLEKLSEVLPSYTQKALQAYDMSGIALIEGKIEGTATAQKNPNISANFTLKNAALAHKESSIAINDITSQGRYVAKAGKEDLLEFNSFDANFEGAEITLAGAMSRLTNPWVNLSLQGNLDLADLKTFLGLSQLATLHGQASVDAKFKGNLGKDLIKNIRKAETSGRVVLNDASFQWLGSAHLVEEVNGTFLLNNRDAAISNLNGIVGESDFVLDGFLRNFIPFLSSENETLQVEAKLKSDKLDLAELMHTTGDKTSGEGYKLSFPKNIVVDLETEVAQVNFRSFLARGIVGKATLKGDELSLSPIRFATAEGSFSARASFTQQKNGDFALDCDANFDQINIQQLFAEFEDFGQDFIRQEHLRGKAKASVDFRATLSPSLYFDPKKIYSSVAITLTDGELIELRSMQSISNYLRQNLIAASLVEVNELDHNLRHIKFATLTNTIKIEKGKIYIPEMDIHSSAMDIAVSGTHNFDNEIDYTLSFNLRDVLKQKESEFGTVADDGAGRVIHMRMHGTTEDPSFGLDKLAAKEKRKEKRQEEKATLRSLLKDPFGKKAAATSTEIEIGEPAQKSGTTVIWDQEKPTEKKPAKKNKLLERFKKNKADEKEENPTVPAEEDDDDDF